MAKEIDIDNLAERILLGDLGRLSQAELDAVLSWISGSEKLGAAALIRRVGVPRERPDVMREVYVQLDAMLFVDGRLHRRQAGVHPGVEDKLRRGRFRRLMTAFHPDRHPDSAEWLTPRSQAVLDAYRQFRTGTEDEREPPGRGAPARPPRRPGRKGARGRWPVERASARLTPQQAGALTRMRIRLRNIDNLQGKILAGLAVLALVPVIGVYFSYKPYRDRLTPAPAPTELAQADLPAERPLTMHPPEPDAVLAPSAEVIGSGGGGETAQQSETVAGSAANLPGEIDLHAGGRSAESVQASGDDLDLDELVGQAADVFDELLAYSTAEYSGGDGGRGLEAAPTGESEDGPLDVGAISRSRPDNPAEADRGSEAAPTAGGEEAESPPDVGAISRSRSDSPAEADRGLEAAPTAGGEEAESPPDVGAISRSRPDEPAEADRGLEAAPTAEVEDSPDVGAISRSRPDNPTEADRGLEAAPTEEEPAEPPIEARIQHLLDTYSLQFAVGNLDGILSLLAANPRENRNRGRDWFRQSYGQLFAESAARRIDIEVLDVEPREDDWRVAARFDLSVNYPDRRGATAEQLVEYSIVEDDDGRLRIRAIDY